MELVTLQLLRQLTATAASNTICLLYTLMRVPDLLPYASTVHSADIQSMYALCMYCINTFALHYRIEMLCSN